MRSKGILSTYTGIIILANVLTFIGFLILQNSTDSIKAVSLIALMPATILAGKSLWTFVTSMFMHAGLGHLFVNMISLM